MSWLSDIFAGGTQGVFQGIGSMAKDLRTAITGNEPLTAEAKARLEEQLTMMEAMAQAKAAEFDTLQVQGQIEINKIDAAGNPYQRNWRPTAGWACVAGLTYTFLLRPLLPWGIQVAAMLFGFDPSRVPLLPPIEIEELMVLLTGMLGLGGMRSFEKVRAK